MNEKIPLCSSDQIIRVLERNGFVKKKKTRGSHQALIRREGSRSRVVIVVLGKKEIKRGTLRSILEMADMSLEQFLKELK